MIEAAEKSGTVKRIVFTQAGAGLVDSEVGDTYGNKMEKLLNGDLSYLYDNFQTANLH